MTAARMSRRTRHPDVRPKPWGHHRWTSPVTQATGASPWADTEAWLATLVADGAIVTGNAGMWDVRLASGLTVTITADTDAARREARAILG